jgi:uncharacterized protein YpmS
MKINEEIEKPTNWKRIYMIVIAFLIFQIVLYAILSNVLS